MKKLILIMGDLAAGKTTFANKLANRYNIVAFNKDEMKEVIADTFPYKTRKESKDISITAVDIMINIFKHFALLNKSLILESNFHEDEIAKIHKIANEYEYDVITLLVQADYEILHQRFINRAKNENRHPVHLSSYFSDHDDFIKYIDYLRNEKVLGKVLQINANDFSYQEDDNVLKQIDMFINN